MGIKGFIDKETGMLKTHPLLETIIVLATVLLTGLILIFWVLGNLYGESASVLLLMGAAIVSLIYAETHFPQLDKARKAEIRRENWTVNFQFIIEMAKKIWIAAEAICAFSFIKDLITGVIKSMNGILYTENELTVLGRTIALPFVIAFSFWSYKKISKLREKYEKQHFSKQNDSEVNEVQVAESTIEQPAAVQVTKVAIEHSTANANEQVGRATEGKYAEESTNSVIIKGKGIEYADEAITVKLDEGFIEKKSTR